MRILKGIEKLAVDANPILSAVIGGNARMVFLSAEHISFYTTLFNFREVEKYVPVLASKRNIPIDDLYLALSMLPLTVCDMDFYRNVLGKAGNMIGERDPDDVHLLSLAFKLSCPVWSNDRHFKGLVQVYSTLDLVKQR